MTTTIVNAAPMTIFRGISDQSTTAALPVEDNLPTHLPKIYFFAKKGPTSPQLVSGDSLTTMYHADSFDLTKAWATHATVLTNTINSQGNAIMAQRLKPTDAGPEASIRLWLDLLPTSIPVYQRGSDGKYLLDADGNPTATGSTVQGFKAKWVVTQVTNDSNGDDTFGTASQMAGDQVDATTSNQSTRYPIMDLRAPYFGADGNNYGLRLWADSQETANPIDSRILSNEKVYPFRAAFVYRASSLSTPVVVDTQTASKYVDLCFKENTMDSNTEAQLFIGDVLIQNYQSLDSVNTPPIFGPFSSIAVYNDNVTAILNLLYAAETPYFSQDGDFIGDGTDKYLFNFLSGTSSTGVPYTSYIVDTSAANSVRMSSNSTIYAQGGSDGTMNETVLAELVATEIAAYGDANSSVQDTARYPESFFYDSGFPLATKKALTNFIAVRKDTFLVLSTHDTQGVALTASQESSLAISLRTAAQLYPESDYYGTPVARCMIVGRSGRLLQSKYTKRLPLTIEIARKAASYMGAGDGKWKPGFSFDDGGENQVTMFTDVNVTFTPATARNKDWDNGLVWVQSYGLRSLFFPALKTVYDNDTSVLNSFFTVAACVELEKIGDRAWRRFTGSAKRSNAKLAADVNQFINDAVVGKFDSRFVITPKTYFTAADLQRGYSWTTDIEIAAPNMKTVATLSVTAKRLDSLTSTATTA